MAAYVLSCCSTVDIPLEHLNARNIEHICFSFEIDGNAYKDDFGCSVPFKEFYQRMREGAMTKTSQINVEEYEEYFEGFLKEGKDVLHLTLSSGITGSINSARLAAEELRERYPNRKVYVVDSLSASAGYGLLMDRLADLRDGGMDLQELRNWAEENRLSCIHWFFTSDLTYLIRGGRVSKTAGFFGQMLNICPLLDVDYEGRLIAREKIRSKKKVIHRIVKKMEEDAAGGTSYNGKCFISHSDCYEDARAVADLIEEKFPDLCGKVEISDIGTTIGSHTGPGTVALFFWGGPRTEK
ncbi:MAG: DegV family protein [Lachnospiraceae bacterium]|nr:DegV family protein [Lachnospiraceae bacterium]